MNAILAPIETVFDLCYLVLVVTLGIKMLQRAKGDRQYRLYGTMAVVLGCGDAFHLVPRVLSLWTPDGFTVNAAALGYGQLVTSVTMTVFYVTLYYVWRARYQVREQRGLTICVWLLAAVRVALCFFPQNDWASPDAPLLWGIYRNIPFAILGLLLIVLFYKKSRQTGDHALRHMWLAVTLSFGFYIPVVLFAGSFPPVGALMLPKTVAYVWIVWMGYAEQRDRVIKKHG